MTGFIPSPFMKKGSAFTAELKVPFSQIKINMKCFFLHNVDVIDKTDVIFVFKKQTNAA